MFKKFFLFLYEILKVVVISLAIIIPVRYYLIQPFYVKGASMEPSFHDREYLIIDEISYRFNDPVRGEIIVFRYPENPQEFFIKRVIGLPGETVEIVNGEVFIYNEQNPNGIEIDETYLPDDVKTYALNDGQTILRGDEYFVMGDNRNASKDSRNFGPVNRSFLTGRVWLRGWPFNKFEIFETPSYQF